MGSTRTDFSTRSTPNLASSRQLLSQEKLGPFSYNCSRLLRLDPSVSYPTFFHADRTRFVLHKKSPNRNTPSCQPHINNVPRSSSSSSSRLGQSTMSSTTGNGPLPSRGLVMPAAFSAMHARRIRDRQQSPTVSSMRQDSRQRDQTPDALQQIAPAPMSEAAPSRMQSLASWQDRRRRHRKSASSGQIGIAFSSPAEARALHDRPLTAEETDSMLDSVLDLYHETGEESEEEEALDMLRQQQRRQAQCEADLQRLSLPETLKDEVLTNSSTRSTPAIDINATTSEEDASKLSQVGQVTRIQPQPSTVPCRRDRYGFRCTSVHVSTEAYDAWSTRYEEHLVRRRAKWDALLSEMPSPSNKDLADQEADALSFPPPSAKLQRYIRKGIPPEYRGRAWFHYAEGPARLKAHPGLYARLVTQAAAKVGDLNNDLIERDLHRTFPDNVHFKPEGYVRSAHSAGGGGVGQDDQDKHAEPPMIHALRRVLQAFALYRPQVGYCQSLNFIAALFLLFLPEEHAFWMLVIMTTEYLPHVHDANLEGANVDQAVLMLAVRESLPAVWSKLGTGFETPTPGAAEGRSGTTFASRRPSLGKLSTASSSASGSIKASNKASPHEIIQTLPPITLVTAAWFMSAFIGSLPIETTLRVWDCLFYEGSKVLFRIALTMLKLGERRLLHVTDPMEIFQTVQALPHSHLDAGALMEACFKRRNGVGHLSQKEVDARRGKVAAIRSRQAAAATMANASPSTTMTTMTTDTTTTTATASPADLAAGQEGGYGFTDGPVRVSQDDLALRVPPVGPVRKTSGRSLRGRLLVRKTT